MAMLPTRRPPLTSGIPSTRCAYWVWCPGPGLQVRNLMLSKAATERIVKECWVAKQRTAERMTLSDFFDVFLRRQFPAPGAALEMAYNVVGSSLLVLTTQSRALPHQTRACGADSLRRHSYDSDLAVFHQVLNGELPEALHHEEVQ